MLAIDPAAVKFEKRIFKSGVNALSDQAFTISKSPPIFSREIKRGGCPMKDNITASIIAISARAFAMPVLSGAALA